MDPEVARTMNRRLVVLILAAIAVLAGCGAGDPNEPAPSTPTPTRTIAPSTLSPATTLVSGLPRQIGHRRQLSGVRGHRPPA